MASPVWSRRRRRACRSRTRWIRTSPRPSRRRPRKAPPLTHPARRADRLRAAPPGSGTPLGDAAAAATGNQRGIPGNAPDGPPRQRRAYGQSGAWPSPDGAGGTRRRRPRPPAWAASRPRPDVVRTRRRVAVLTRRRGVPGPRRRRRAARAPADGRPARPGWPAPVQPPRHRMGRADRVRWRPDDLDGNRRPGGPGNGHRTNPDGSLTGSIDADEVTEGVRIVREQRQQLDAPTRPGAWPGT